MARTKKTPTRTKTGAGKAAGARTRAPSKPKKLVVVESPAKAKTINRYLGADYTVRASMGHVRDLPAKKLGVDTDDGFKPTYEPLTGRKKILAELKKFAKAADEVFLATDLDREGEAIAWHLAEGLDLPDRKIRRVVFNEITKDAITEAFDHPRTIDMDKVNAQQARRILDRIVGYQVSPLLWRKVAGGLSAGRVQTVAVRLIVERQREIDAFVPEEYWKIGGIFTPDCRAADDLALRWAEFLARKDSKGAPPTQAKQQEFLSAGGAFRAELMTWKGKRFKTDDAETAIRVARALGLSVDKVHRTEDPDAKGPARNLVVVGGGVSAEHPAFTVRSLKHRQTRSNAPGPFTTASMQQAASVQLRLGTSRTMRIAQQLYEGIDVPGEGVVGLITYMRTDSRHISDEALGRVRSLIEDRFGSRYSPEKPRRFSSGDRAQQAHEAIRPTDATRSPEDLRTCLSAEQFKLYELIWKRFVACQMSPAVWNVTEVDVAAETDDGEAIFKAMGRNLQFDGFLRVAGIPKSAEQTLPDLEAQQTVAPIRIDPTQHFTQPPPRYTEASLVKALEADGIGRPSTYASIIQTIQDRKYVELLDRAFRPTDLGMVVTDKLVKHFPRIFDVRFTAHMEDQLDRVEESRMDWVAVLEEFYGPFSENLKRAGEEMVHAKAETQPSEYTCPKCEAPMVYRFGKNGRFLSCSRYPECKHAMQVDRDGQPQETPTVDVACPKCGRPMALRKGRFGPFLSCTRYPECDGLVNLDRKGFVKPPAPPPLKVDANCPKCDSPLNLRRGKRGLWLSCSKFPKCRGRVGWTTLKPAQQKELERKFVDHEKAHPTAVLHKLDGTKIGEEYIPEPTVENDKTETPEKKPTREKPKH